MSDTTMLATPPHTTDTSIAETDLEKANYIFDYVDGRFIDRRAAPRSEFAPSLRDH